LKTFETHV